MFQYQAPFKTFNPWANYNTPQDNAGFNYTQDPYYNAANDQQKWDLAQTGAGSESNRARVWRWTLDELRAKGMDPGKADQTTVQQAYLHNIGRLHQDYAANKFDWGKSGFAGYDKFLATPPGQGPGGPPPVDPSGNPLPTNTGRPTTPTQNGGLGAGQPVNNAPAPSPTAPPPTTNPGLGGTPGVNGGLSAAGATELSSDPNLAYDWMIRQLGLDPSAPSRFGEFLKKRFSPILQANLAASQVQNGGAGGSNYLDQFGNTVNRFGSGLFQQGGNFFGNQANIANQALGSQTTADYLGGIQDQSQVEQYLNQLATLKYAGANPMIQQSVADTLQRGQGQYDLTAFDQLNGGKSLGDPYLEWLRNNPLYNRYLGVR